MWKNQQPNLVLFQRPAHMHTKQSENLDHSPSPLLLVNSFIKERTKEEKAKKNQKQSTKTAATTHGNFETGRKIAISE